MEWIRNQVGADGNMCLAAMRWWERGGEGLGGLGIDRLGLWGNIGLKEEGDSVRVLLSDLFRNVMFQGAQRRHLLVSL